MTPEAASLTDPGSNAIKLYPNPAKDRFTINFTNKVNSSVVVSVFNTFGKLEMEEILPENQNELNVGTLNRGVYFVKIEAADMNKIVKLVIE